MDFGYAIIDDVTAAFGRAVETGATSPAEPRHILPRQTASYERDHVGTLIGIATPIGA